MDNIRDFSHTDAVLVLNTNGEYTSCARNQFSQTRISYTKSPKPFHSSARYHFSKRQFKKPKLYRIAWHCEIHSEGSLYMQRWVISEIRSLFLRSFLTSIDPTFRQINILDVNENVGLLTVGRKYEWSGADLVNANTGRPSSGPSMLENDILGVILHFATRQTMSNIATIRKSLASIVRAVLLSAYHPLTSCGNRSTVRERLDPSPGLITLRT